LLILRCTCRAWGTSMIHVRIRVVVSEATSLVAKLGGFSFSSKLRFERAWGQAVGSSSTRCGLSSKSTMKS
jgi:hypothetical protein